MNAEPAFISKCIYYFLSLFLYTDTMVTGKKPTTIYVCQGEMILLGNKCYTFSDKALSWNEADWSCRENKTRLAVIRTKHQDVKLKKFLNRGFVGKCIVFYSIVHERLSETTMNFNASHSIHKKSSFETYYNYNAFK